MFCSPQFDILNFQLINCENFREKILTLSEKKTEQYKIFKGVMKATAIYITLAYSADRLS